MRLLLPILLLLPACATIKKPFLYSAEKEGKQITLLGTIHTSVLANDFDSADRLAWGAADPRFEKISTASAELKDVLEDLYRANQ